MKNICSKISATFSWLAVLFFISCQGNGQQAKVKDTKKSSDKLYKKYHLDKITLPPGFTISVYAEVPNARSMCWGTKGTLFVGNKTGGNVFAVIDDNNDGNADTVFTIARGLNTPNGVAFKNGNLYVAEINRILRFDNIEEKLLTPPAPVVVTDKFPDETHHGWKYIAFGPDNKLYVPVGAPCNVCESKDTFFSTITRMNPDGSNIEIYAKGIRNSVGFAWHPKTKELWFTENGRDEMGDDKPYDELNYAPKKGMHFGFPYCHQGDISDPEFGKGKSCADYSPPARTLAPHIAALGMLFYTEKGFPAEYNNQVFIAEHGSWNRSTPLGYRVSLAKLDGNKVTDYTTFASGWLQKDGTVLGRPVDVKTTKDGGLLVSDDYAGVIYKIMYQGK